MIFAFFGLWSTTLAAGAAAVSIPIVIHLLNRRRYRTVTWAAMRFLLAAQKQNVRSMRLEQLLLLLVRCLAMALLVFAMASVTPWAETVWATIWPEGSGVVAHSGTRTHHLFVLDASLSMNVPDEGGKSIFLKARQLAIQKILDAPAGDSFSVLLMKDKPEWVVGESSFDARKVAAEVGRLSPGHGNASAATTLGVIAAKLDETARRFPSQTVYFLTDMQRATWLANTSAEVKKGDDNKDHQPFLDIQRRARTIFVDVGRDGIGNLAVTDLTLDSSLATTGIAVPISATIHNYDADTKKNVRIELLAGRARTETNDAEYKPHVVAQELRDIRAGERMTVNFAYTFPSAGVYSLEVRVEDDPLLFDNARAAVVTVKDTIPVLLVNGKQATDRFDRATEYVRFALNPFPAGAEPRYAPLRPRVVSLAQFADLTEAELSLYDCIFLCDVPQFGTSDLRKLESHVRRGGGLIVSLGDRAADNLEVYNRLLFKNGEGLLPATLLKKVSAPAEYHFLLQAEEEAFLRAPLKAFADDDDRISLRSGRFRQFVEARPIGESDVRTILSFLPESAPGNKEAEQTLPANLPALLEWNPPYARANQVRREPTNRAAVSSARQRGKVVLFTSSLNLDWNTWPGSPSFGAMMQELVRLAVSGRLHAHAANVGDLIEEYFPGETTEREVSIFGPADAPDTKVRKSRTVASDEATVFRYADTNYRGIYRVLQAGSPKEWLFAFNVPPTTPDQRGSESDLTRVVPQALQDVYPGWDFQIVKDPRFAQIREVTGTADVAEERGPVGPVIARYVLLVFLVLLFAEVILAWRFGHYSAVEGSSPQAAGTMLWPLTLIGVAGAVMVAGVFILGHAQRSGDLLGFLPERLRLWTETLLGLPTPPAGESTRWALETWPIFGTGVHDGWYSFGLVAVAIGLVGFIYRAEAPTVGVAYKGILGLFRLFLIAVTLAVLLPQLQVRFDRQSWPELVLLIDDSLSMAEPDQYSDAEVRTQAEELAPAIKQKLLRELPTRIAKLEEQTATKTDGADGKDPAKDDEIALLDDARRTAQSQLVQLNAAGWRPTRLQLAQALLSQPNGDWLDRILHERRSKVHLFHLGANGQAVPLLSERGEPVDISDPSDPRQLEAARRAIAVLEPHSTESRLGTAVRQVIDQYRGGALSCVIMLTDGVTTREESLGDVAEYASQRSVPLFFVGLGDDYEARSLDLHDLQVEDSIYVNDRAIFEARLTGHGQKELSVPVTLKLKNADGTETEVDRQTIAVDVRGKAVKVRLHDQPSAPGHRVYVIEIDAPGADHQNPSIGTTRLERSVEVLENKLIKVLYVEFQPRYEFRFIKTLLERESPDANKNRSIDLKVVLLDADSDFPKQDKSALSDFPVTRAELDEYDVVILGDCDPQHPQLGNQRLKNLADYVRGEDSKGKKSSKAGGGLLMIAGPLYAPQAYKDTPLADVLPITPLSTKMAPEPDTRLERIRLEPTAIGRLHPILRFSPDEAENLGIWQKLAPMFWSAGGYVTKPLAEILAVNPRQPAIGRDVNQNAHFPLIAQQFVGSGRSMFFGFEESWRWRLRDDEVRFNQFWIQTVRYLARGRGNRTDLRLDRQTPYRMGEPIKVAVRFPENLLLGDTQPGKAPEVKVIVEYRPITKTGLGEPEVQTLQLAKLEGSWASFEGLLNGTRAGKYRFWLSTPDVTRLIPGAEKPMAEAIVDLPPGELEKLRMNQVEMNQAAQATEGRFYTLATVRSLIDDLPAGQRISLTSPTRVASVGGGDAEGSGTAMSGGSVTTPGATVYLWNQWPVFLFVVFLFTCEWILRKRKHLL